ncbi:hypothetical protein V6U89_11905 [Micromonospora sp. CPCC 206171]|uniref:hypothetical protein n=1 Tax=Micromonospora sp. CPCC 206171 TaxID=3122405 RepID=UPI002FEEC553
MADDTTGVRVTHTSGEDHHPTGRDVGIENGHLTVYDSENRPYARTVAVYAPQRWVSALVERKQQQG